eukprot:Skav210066  [mRNA]  locus=scaffold485:126447:137581:+ [translate_table: standard]
MRARVTAPGSKDRDTALWGLTGTPCLDDFAGVAKLVRACSDVDLMVFRRQLDAKDLAPQMKMKMKICSHFRLHGPADCDAETESAALLRRRRDACETSRAWLLMAARRMEMHILQAWTAWTCLHVVYNGLHERDADDLILQAILEIRSGLSADDWKESLEALLNCPLESGTSFVSSDTNALELLEEVKQAKEAFRQRSSQGESSYESDAGGLCALILPPLRWYARQEC